MWTLVALACVPDSTGLIVSAELAPPPDEAIVAAARELSITTREPTRLVVTLDDGTRRRRLRFPEPATSRVVPILGFTPGSRSEVLVEATGPGGEVAEERWDVDIAPLPERFPGVDVLTLDPDRVEPGWTLLDAKVPKTEVQYLLLLDETFAPIWWWTGGPEFGDARLLDNGHLLALGDGQAWELDFLGRVAQRWGASGAEGEGPLVPLDHGDLNHEVFPTDEGFYSLTWAAEAVDAFPVDYLTPEELGPAVLADQHLLQYGWDGEPRMDLALVDLLDPKRIGFDSLDEVSIGLDWVHVNGIIPDPQGGGVIVNTRHQDVTFALDAAGTITWMLGTPSGWREPWASLLLTPVGEPFAWPYHAHAPELAPDGTLVLFDNQFHGYNPYEPEIDQPPARVVGYRIDREARTVSQAFSLSETTTGLLRSDALGDADVLPQTGNILADFGFVPGESGRTNPELGFGSRSVRLVEWTADGEVVGDVRLRSEVQVEREGWKTYRCERLVPWAASGAGHAELAGGE